MNIQEIRQKFPQYHDLSDTQIADSLHQKHYNDIPKEQFYKKIGVSIEPETQENFFQKAIRYGIKDPAIGVLNMGREFANLPHKVSGGRIPELSPSDFDFSKQLGVQNPDVADNLIQGISQFAPALALPGANLGRAGKALSSIPKVGRFAAKAASDAIPQALYAASQSPENSVESGAQAGATMVPFSILDELMKSGKFSVRSLAKLGAGIGAGFLGREAVKGAGASEGFSDAAGLAAGALAARGFNNKRHMKKELTQGVSPDIAKPRIEAAERLGLDYLTPAEAGVNPFTSRVQGSLGRTPEGSKMLYEKGMERRESEKNSITKALDAIYSEKEMAPQIKAAYDSIKPLKLGEDFTSQYADNEIINRAKKVVEAKPAYKESLKGVEEDSLVYWDHIKRSLDDMINVAERRGSNDEARILSNTRSEMRDQMDDKFPQYKEARALYERKMVRKGLEKVFDQKEINGTNFYRALASQKKFDEVLSHLKNAPEAAQNLKDMRLLFKDLMGPPTIKTAKGTEERGMNQNRNDGNFIQHLLQHAFTKGGNDKAAIEFITSKDWHKQLQDINKISDRQMKLVALGMALSKGVAQAAGQQEF